MRSPWATPLDRLPSGTPDEGIGGFIAGARILAERFDPEPQPPCPTCGEPMELKGYGGLCPNGHITEGV